ncbi:uncharacterized protein RJT20DRAFT_131424 [Scheffersomyces xylosifermentans]|uniref:uncharacterized protein n=1 Tax=Scheffersomyces xylosifermentans TaxID=1304137 RepID=UPI00315D4ED5
MSNRQNSILKLKKGVSNVLQSQAAFESFSVIVGELLKNSVDAKATKISVKFDLVSLLVQVADNGTGISLKDFQFVGKQHYTSKFNDEGIREQYGYRGGALHSLSSISKVTIVSKHESDDENYITVLNSSEKSSDVKIFESFERNGGLFGIVPLKHHGTVVTSTSIFAKLPLRRNYLLSVPHYKVVEDIKRLALTVLLKHPGIVLDISQINHEKDCIDKVVHFSMKSLDSDTSRGEVYAGIIRNIYGSAVLPNYKTLKASNNEYTLEGIVGTRAIKTQNHQYLFSDGLPVVIPEDSKRLINRLFRNANFGGKLNELSTTYESPSKRGAGAMAYPVYLINVMHSRNELDVKKFFEEVLEIVLSNFLISEGYQINSHSYGGRAISASPYSSPTKRKLSGRVEKKFTTRQAYPLKQLANASTPEYDSCSETHGAKWNMSRCSSEEPLSELKLPNESFRIGQHRVIRQIDEKFILIVVDRNNEAGNDPFLTIIDQHACDERIRVERLLRNFIAQVFDNDVNLSLRLAEPLSFEVSSAEIRMFDQFEENFNTFGIHFKICDNSSLIVTHLPHVLALKLDNSADFIESSLLHHLYQLERGEKKPIFKAKSGNLISGVMNLPTAIVEAFNSRACRSSVMFGEHLSHERMVDMVEQLSRCELPFQCAHGRPSIVPLARLG